MTLVLSFLRFVLTTGDATSVTGPRPESPVLDIVPNKVSPSLPPLPPSPSLPPSLSLPPPPSLSSLSLSLSPRRQRVLLHEQDAHVARRFHRARRGQVGGRHGQPGGENLSQDGPVPGRRLRLLSCAITAATGAR